MEPSGDAAPQLIVLFILLALSAFFSSAETALTTVNKMRIRSLAEKGNKRAGTVLKVIENPGKMLSAILVGNNVVNLSASSLSTILAADLFGSAAVGAATGILTLFVLIFGEITPKTISTLSPEKISILYAPVIYGLMVILTPVIFFVNKLAMIVLKLLRVDADRKKDVITEDELRAIVEASHEEGVLHSEEKKIITNVFDFGESLAKEIMVPSVNIEFINVNATYDEILETYKKEKYTRFPVYEENKYQVIGIINVKDMLLIEDRENFQVKEILRQPLYTYEFKRADDLMMEMRRTLNNTVIVLDEYGATAGLITMEDMLEEIVGEIQDEYDGEKPEMLEKLDDGCYRAMAEIRLDELNEQLEMNLQSEGYDSLGGLIISSLDRVPKEGEKVEFQDLGICLQVECMDGKRVRTVRITKKAVA